MDIFARLFAILFALGLLGAGICTPALADGYLVEAKRADDTYHQFAVSNFATFDAARAEANSVCQRDRLYCYTFRPLHNSCGASAVARTSRGEWRVGFGHDPEIERARHKALSDCSGWFSGDASNSCAITVSQCDLVPATATQKAQPSVNAPVQPNVGQPAGGRQLSDILADAIVGSDAVKANNESRRMEAELATVRAEQNRVAEKQSQEARTAADAKRAADRAASPFFTAVLEAVPGFVAFLMPIAFVLYAFAVLNGEPKHDFDLPTRGHILFGSFCWGLVSTMIFELAVGARVWLNAIPTHPDTYLTFLIFGVPGWFIWKHYRPHYVIFREYVAVPGQLLKNFPAFIRGLVFLCSRHPAERVIEPALRTGKPINGKKLVAATRADSRAPLPSLFKTWLQRMRARQLAERANAAAAKTEADRDVHLAAQRLEIARGEEQAAREAFEQTKRDARDRRKKT